MRMRALFLGCSLAAVVAACSPSPAPDAASSPEPAAGWMPTQVEVDRFVATGAEPALRQLSTTSYVLHYRLMEATGIVEALGGEAQAVAALQALGIAYERQLRGRAADAPALIPAAFTGEGMSSGFIGMGMGGFAGMLTGGMMSGGIASLSDARLAELVAQGPIRLDGKGGSLEMTVGDDGALQDITLEVDESGVTGKVRIRPTWTHAPIRRARWSCACRWTRRCR